jgi:hypothetical protein
VLLALLAWALCAALVLAARKAHGENVHRPGADCRTCHTLDPAGLSHDPARARTSLRADLEATCNGCHGSQGASHRTGMHPKSGVPDTLPLSADGKITCFTCHFMHGENNQFGDFVRIDNRRGKLCLTCHRLSELQ